MPPSNNAPLRSAPLHFSLSVPTDLRLKGVGIERLCILASTADFTTQLPDEVTDGTLEAECWEIIADFVGSIHFHPSAAPWESEVGKTRVDRL